MKLIKLYMWLMAIISLIILRTIRHIHKGPLPEGVLMEAHGDSNKRALGLHYTRHTLTTRADKCGAASSPPMRATSASPPEALLRYTHTSRLQPAAAESVGGCHKLRAQVRRRG